MIRSSFWALIILTSVNYLNYIDRFVLASLLNTIKIDLTLTDTQAGLLGTAFMLPYFLTSPIFGRLGDTVRRNLIVGFGVIVWSAATILSGLSPGYRTLFSSRAILGVGESIFTVNAPAWLAEFFPSQKRGRMLAIYSAALPVGAAIGYLIGGVLADLVGWRHTFWLVSIPGFFMAVFVFRLIDPGKTKAPVVEQHNWSHLSKLFLTNGSYLTAVSGYCAYTFVLGGLSHWMPTFLQRYHSYTPSQAGLIFGGIAIVSGLLGTLVGGWLSDSIEKNRGNGYAKVCSVSMLLSIPFFIWTISTGSKELFLVLAFITEFLFFVSTSPINVMILQPVPREFRSSAMAFSIFFSHLLGDAVSSPLIGYISDVTGGLQTGFWICVPFIVLATILWSWCWIGFWRGMRWPQGALVLPRFQSHRGNWMSGVQENTIDAFVSSKQNYFEMFECDVRLSKDNEVVICHDSTLARLINLKSHMREQINRFKDERNVGGISGNVEKAVELNVNNLTKDKLKELANIPTLKEVLNRSDIPQKINIELKSENYFDRSLEIKVAQLIKELKCEDRVLFSSFNPMALRTMAKLLPDVPRGLLVGGDKKGLKHTLRRIFSGWSCPHIIHVEDTLVTKRRIQSLGYRLLPIAVWTVKSPQKAHEFLEMGVQSIIVDGDQFGQP